MDSILKTLDERKFEEAAEVQATNDSLRAHWRMQTDRSLRPEWDIIDPDTLKKVRVDATRGYKLASRRTLWWLMQSWQPSPLFLHPDLHALCCMCGLLLNVSQTLPPRAEDGTSRVGPSAIQVFECETKSSPDEKARRNREFVQANDAILRERAAARARAEEEARYVSACNSACAIRSPLSL